MTSTPETNFYLLSIGHSTLEPETKQGFEALLLEFHDIFARHRLDIENIKEFKVQFKPLDNKPA